jgi:hypothetical protein
MRFYLSEDQVLDGGDLLLQEIGLGAVRAGDFKTKRLNVSLNPGHSANDKHVIAWIDSSNLAMEWEQINNLVGSQKVL